MIRVLMSACLLMAALPAMAKDEPTPAQLAADHGLVTARFHGTLPATQLGVLMLSPPTLGLRPAGGRDNGRDDVYLQVRQDNPESFGSWLPAGRYRMASWRLSRWAEGPEIEVVAGRITDLGDLLEVSLGGDDVVLLPITHPEVDSRLDPWRAEVGAHLVSQEALRWQPDQVPAPIKIVLQSTSGMYGGGLIMDLMMRSARNANRTEVKAQLRDVRSLPEFEARALEALPPTRDEAAFDDKGRTYFGADFGRVRVREADGRWHTLDTGTLADVTAVEWRAGTLMAGTESGQLFASTDEGKTWSTLRRFDRNEAIGDLDRVGDRWIVLTAHGEYNPKIRMITAVRSTVYGASADDLSDLAQIKRFDQKINNPFVLWKAPRGDGAGDYYYVEAFPKLQRLHLPSGEWLTLKVPGAVTGVAVSSDTGAVTAVGRGLYLSRNHGEKWTRLFGPGGKGMIGAGRFHDMSRGWLATWRNPTPNTSVLVVQELGEGDTAWKTHEDAPLGCLRILRDAAGDPGYCVSVDGTLLRREGLGWIEEFSIN